MPALREKTLDGAMPVEGLAVPKPGDISVCAYCAEVLTFGKSLRLEVVAEDHPARDHHDVQMAQLKIGAMLLGKQPRRNNQ